ncbi:unnamed protein product [Rotaria magnacalcarata]|uniref:Branchpoint-bridging protein n=3 Tax=Rotaria magnacalcarata TaxID=392030 RepID=A0A816UEN3_9BILA|nr:unnamed protein product [Rotaria magnacalcarata]CAF4204227.1 unnamed protein product [Rotaria magnacalcarata]
MSSRSPRSRSRSPSKKHKKSHKHSRKSSDEGSPPVSNLSIKTEEGSLTENNSVYKARLPSVMLPPSFLAKLDVKDDEKTRSPTGDQSPAESTSNIAQPARKRKRRFGDETDRVFLPNMPTTISATTMTDQQQKIYVLQVQIEELTRRLKMSDLGISTNSEARSPSPEPIYDQQGKRQNTREVRTRRKIEEQRHRLVTELLVLNPEYKAPADYKPTQAKYIDKVMIPQEDHPDINFVGLIIGPRGNTLKTLEKETNAKIIIRGKGSIKDGKMGLVKFGPLPGEDEPLHAYITGTSPEIVAKAVEKVKQIINQAIDEPEGMNELRKQQLRELALLHGTLRENDCLIKLKIIDEAEKIVTNTIVCTICGGAGHVTSDCKFRKKPDGTYAELNPDGSLMINGTNRAEQQKLDCEYQSLMNELTGKKDSDTNSLSLEDRKNLMSGSRTNGPTLAITGGIPPTSTPVIAPMPFNNPTTTNNNGMPNTINNYNPPSLMSLHTNNSSSTTSTTNTTTTTQPQTSTNYWSNTGPRYNNNDVFDGHYLLRRNNRSSNYSSYIEGDSYRAQHIPALMENGGSNSNNTNSSTSWSNPQNPQQWSQWNQYNTAMYYQSVYQQQYYQNNNAGFVPPLPKTAPPPPPPPR